MFRKALGKNAVLLLRGEIISISGAVTLGGPRLLL